MRYPMLSAVLLSVSGRSGPPAPQTDAVSAFLLHLALLRGNVESSPCAVASTELPCSLSGPACAMLSPREREVARLLVEGYAALNVAARLGVTEHTVRTYTRRIYRKLQVVSRVQLAGHIYGRCG